MRFEREHIDGASFPADVEGDFNRDVPASSAKQRGDVLNEICVRRIQESVQRLAVPQKAEVDPCAECGGERFEGLEREAVESAALESRDGAARHPRG